MIRQLPKRAELMERVGGILRDGSWTGKAIESGRYIVPGRFADGGTEYVTVKVEGGPNRCFRYSGKNRPQAAEQIRQLRAHLIGK